ncbi:MAG: TIGR00341 family protein [Candidatus Paceibacterota bacterium]
MSIISRFKIGKESDKEKAVERLITESTPDFDFFFLVVLSVLMASLGLLVNNVAVVIGSMLIAPILYPILSLSLGIVISDSKLIYRSFFTVLKASSLAIIASFLITLFFSGWHEGLTSEILLRTEPSFIYFTIALIAGLAVAYTLAYPTIDSTLPGIAVSVALIPPLAVIGIGFAKLNPEVIGGSFVLFILNISGIIFASLVAFSLMDFTKKREVVKNTIQKEERRVETEEKKVKEVDKEAEVEKEVQKLGKEREQETEEKREGN